MPCAVALLIRLVVVAFVFRETAGPSVNHEAFGWEVGWTARSIAAGEGFSSPFFPPTGPTALVPPIYTYLLAFVFRLFGIYSATAAVVILSLNSVFSALTCLPVFRLASRFLAHSAARSAVWLWVFYPFSIYFSAGRVWEYALTALLFTSAVALVAELPDHGGTRPWLLFGLLAGVAVLTNPAVLPALCALLALAAFRQRKNLPTALRNVSVALLTLVLVCTPWLVRNYPITHAISLRDGFWLEFWAGNNGDTADSNIAYVHPPNNSVEMDRFRSLGESAYFARDRQLALTYVGEHPGFFVTATLRRILRFWTGFWSLSRTYIRDQPLDLPNIPFCTAVTSLMLLGLWRWTRQDPVAVHPFVVALVVYPLPYYLTHTAMDYRQPLEPLIVILAVVGCKGTQGAWRQRPPIQDEVTSRDFGTRAV